MRGQRICLKVVVCVVFAIAGCENREAAHAEPDVQRVEAEVRDMLSRWAAAFGSRDAEGVRDLLADGDGFVWLEDGEAKYRGEESIVTALASFPSGMAFSHELKEVRVTPLSNDAAWAEVATKTEIRQGGTMVAGFDGVVLIVAKKQAGAWTVAAGHTSTLRPRQR